MPSLCGSLRLAALLLGLGIPAVVTHTLGQQHVQALADAEQRAANTARALSQHAERSFEAVDTYLRAVVTLVGPGAGTLSPEVLHTALREHLARARGLTNITIVDRDGRTAVEAIGFPSRTLDMRERDYFQRLRDHPVTSLVVGEPIRGRTNGKLLVPVARRIDAPDGTFAGVVQAMLDAEAFRSVYEAIDNGPGAALSLWRADGTLLARAPWAPEMIGRNYAAGPNYRLHVPARDDRPFWSPATTDGIERVFAFGFIDAYPVYVSAAVSRDDALVGWHRSALAQGSLAGGLTIVLVTALLLLARELKQRQNADARTRASEERLAHALDSGSDGLWDWDLTTRTVWVSDRWYLMLGYGIGEFEVRAETWRGIAHPDDAERALATMREHLRGRIPVYECEYRLSTKDGGYIWVLTRGKVVARDQAGRALRMVGTQIDITQRKQAERQIAHMATHDGLTELPNRALFGDRLDHALATARRHGDAFAVMVCDLDRFKAVNDTLGHPAGDALLCVTAQRLRSVIGDGDTVARLGGDEFAIIACHLAGPQGASILAQRVIEAVGRPIDLDGHTASVGVSIGIAFGDDANLQPDTLYKQADTALYRAKMAGRNGYSFYEPELDAAIATRNLLERDLRDAIHRGGFVLHYQPIVSIADGTVGGFEALLRWQHPTRGAISPVEFIPLAEETGLIVALGEWAVREACREAASWPGDLRVAVNISAVQFERPGLEQVVLGALVASGLSPHRLELEITESVLMQDSDAAISFLHRLKALGISIALDDFGTGFSSLSYLRRFPFDKIKIDRAFIRDIGDPDTAAIVRAIVGIGAQLGATITAEGVETDGQLEQVRREGCTAVQGFLYSRPVPAADALAFADTARTLAA